MRSFNIIIILLLLSSCTQIPAPSILTPSSNYDTRQVSYGELPDNYQKILKDYLIKNLDNYKEAKVEFINEPEKLSIDHLGDSYTGYRICLSINVKQGEYYRGYRNHFFMIKDGGISLHLFDSGLLKIPFEYCVSRDSTNEIFIEDIPDQKEEITVDKMDDKKIITKRIEEYRTDTIYILCDINGSEFTYLFNEKNKIFKNVDGVAEKIFEVEFNEAFIVASSNDTEAKINRVSGKITTNNGTTGTCALLNKTKF